MQERSDSQRIQLTKTTRKSKVLAGVMVGVCASSFSLLLWSVGYLQPIEFTTWSERVDFLARPAPTTDRVKLVVIDDPSLAHLQKHFGLSWVWPRQVYEMILSFLKRGGARSVTFDMLYEQPSTHGVEDDKTFGKAIKEGPPFVAAFALLGGQRQEEGEDSSVSVAEGTYAETWPQAEKQDHRFTLQMEGLMTWLDVAEASVVVPHAQFPIPDVLGNTDAIGNVASNPDEDGIIRRISLFRVFDGRAVPSLALATYLIHRKAELSVRRGRLTIGEQRIGIDRHAQAILRYRGRDSTHEKYSAFAVINSELKLREGKVPDISPETFRDCHVFFGITAKGGTGGHDIKATPIDERFPGVEIQATALDNLLANDFLRQTPEWLTVITVVTLSILAGILGLIFTKVWQNVLAFFIYHPMILCCGLLMYEAGYWWPVFVHNLGVLSALVGTVAVHYATEGRQRRFVKQAFTHYLSPAVIDRVLKDPSKLALGGERRELTIFFSDLQGFTSISEMMEPQELTQLLNEYLSDMTDIILDEGGTLDKYEGDAIIAFWGAPISQPDHALRGVRAVIRCQRKLAERRKEFEERYGAVLKMRIGMHTGDVVVGNMGSKRRFDYTMLGDAANLAARLEGANKAFHTYTMISEVTWAKVKEHVRAREIGALRVVGRKVPVAVYEPYALITDDEEPHYREIEGGVTLAKEGKWQEAIEILQTFAEDPVAGTYLERCRELIAADNADWDGVWNLTSK